MKIYTIFTCLLLGLFGNSMAQISFSFANNAFNQVDVGKAFVDYSGVTSNAGATGYYKFHISQSTSDDFNITNLQLQVNSIAITTSGMVYLNDISTGTIISGIVPQSAGWCETAEVSIWVTNVLGQPVSNVFTYTVHAGTGPLNGHDLVMRDDEYDQGKEPYRAQKEADSPDIWLRRQADGQTEHQNPDYVSVTGNANQMYARIQNTGCHNSTPADLHLYWTRARTVEKWDDHWLHFTNPSAPDNYRYYPTGSTNKVPMGGEITITHPNNAASLSDPYDIPTLNPGQIHVISPVAWFPPNPLWYKKDGDPMVMVNEVPHPAICFLARIVSSADPMYNEMNPRNVIENVRNNNNIVTRNSYLTNDPAYKKLPDASGNYDYGWTSYEVVNTSSGTETIDLEITANSEDTPDGFQDYGFVNVALSTGLWAAWDAGGRQGVGIQVVAEGLLRMVDPNIARISNIELDAGDDFQMAFQYRFIGSQAPSTDLTYHFQLTQYETGTQNDMGSPNQMVTVVEAQLNKSQPAASSPVLDLNTYPNPAEGSATISFSLTAASEITLILRNLHGQEVVRLADNALYQPGQHSLPLNLEGLAAGNYLLLLQTPETVLTRKITHHQAAK